MNMATILLSNTSMRGLVTSLVLLAALGSSAAETSDAKRLEGSWLPEKAELAGQPFPEVVLKTISLKLTAGKYEVSVAGQPDKGTYTIDSSTKPKGMLITGTDGPNQGKTFQRFMKLRVRFFASATICLGNSARQSLRPLPGLNSIWSPTIV